MARRNTAAAAQPQVIDTTAVVTSMDAVTLVPPDTTQAALERVMIESLAAFRVTDDSTFIQANQHYEVVGTYLDKMEALFAPAVSAANKAHKTLTQLRGFFLNPGETAKKNLNGQILAWRQKKEQERLAEEARLRRLEEERLAEILRQAQEADAQRRTEAEAAQAELMPWEEAAPIPEPAPVILPEPVEIRLPSTIPQILGGPSARKLPWAARFKAADPANGVADGRVSFLLWVLQNPADRLGFIDWDSVASKLRGKAAEFGAETEKVIPGVEGYQGETLAR